METLTIYTPLRSALLSPCNALSGMASVRRLLLRNKGLEMPGLPGELWYSPCACLAVNPQSMLHGWGDVP